jgi:hypothetical protein
VVCGVLFYLFLRGDEMDGVDRAGLQSFMSHLGDSSSSDEEIFRENRPENQGWSLAGELLDSLAKKPDALGQWQAQISDGVIIGNGGARWPAWLLPELAAYVPVPHIAAPPLILTNDAWTNGSCSGEEEEKPPRARRVITPPPWIAEVDESVFLQNLSDNDDGRYRPLENPPARPSVDSSPQKSPMRTHRRVEPLPSLAEAADESEFNALGRLFIGSDSEDSSFTEEEPLVLQNPFNDNKDI